MIKNFGKSLGIIFIYFFVSYLLQILYIFTGIKNTLITNLIALGIEIVSLFVIIFLLKDRIKESIKNLKVNYKEKIKITFKYWFIGLLLMMVANFIIYYLIKGNIAPNEAANREILLNAPIYSILSMCLIAPVSEELLFRLNFKNCFKNRYSYAITTGIIFGLMHIIISFSMDNLIYLIPYSILGITFGFIFYDTESIGYSILAHSFHNGISVLAILTNI